MNLKDSIAALRQANPTITNGDIRDYLAKSPQMTQLLNQQYTDDAGAKQSFTPNDVWDALNLQDQFSTPLKIGPLDVGREAVLAGNAFNQGLGATLSLPGRAEQALRGAFPDQAKALDNALGGGDSADTTFFPTPADISGVMKNAGLGPNSALTPQNFGEDQLKAGAQGAGSAAPLVPFLGPAALTSGATGGLGANLAAEALPDVPLAPVVGGLAGGMVGGSGAAAAGLLTKGNAMAAAAKAISKLGGKTSPALSMLVGGTIGQDTLGPLLSSFGVPNAEHIGALLGFGAPVAAQIAKRLPAQAGNMAAGTVAGLGQGGQ